MNTLDYVMNVAEGDIKFGNIAEALGYSLPKALFGFTTVFSVLALIWGILVLFKLVFYTLPNSKKTKAIPTEKVIEATPVQPMEQQEDTGAIVAAITAAISAFRGQTSGSDGSFRVVSFKKRK